MSSKSQEKLQKITSIIGALLLIWLGQLFVRGVLESREAAIGGPVFLIGGALMIVVGIGLLVVQFKPKKKN